MTKMGEKLQKADKTLYGVIAGIMLPLIGFVLCYWILFYPNGKTFDEFINITYMSPDRQTNILIFCLLPNMFAFYLTNFRWRMNHLTKGLVGSTLILGLILVIIAIQN